MSDKELLELALKAAGLNQGAIPYLWRNGRVVGWYRPSK